MNLNVKLSITDRDRNVIARKMAGKAIKRLASRTDINDLVNGFIEAYITEIEKEEFETKLPAVAPDLSRVPEQYAGKTIYWKASYLRTRYRT